MSAVSSTFSSTLRYALIEERHFALVVVCAFPTWARFESSGSGTRFDPAISSITYCDQDSLIRTPSPAGSGMPNHYIGDLLHTIAMSGLSRVRTELLLMAVVATLAPHPLQVHRQFPRHRYFRDLPSSSQGEVEECAAPLGTAAHRTCALPCPEGGDVLRVRHFCKSFSEPLATISPIDATRWRSSGWRPIASSHAALPTLW